VAARFGEIVEEFQAAPIRGFVPVLAQRMTPRAAALAQQLAPLPVRRAFPAGWVVTAERRASLRHDVSRE
jgi:hypothetical protein